jgi:hypothetical protein
VNKIGEIFRRIWAWSLANQWRNWSFHAGIAFALSFVVGAWTAGVFYVLMEIQEAVIQVAFDGRTDWKDHAGDAGFPVVAAWLAHVLFAR